MYSERLSTSDARGITDLVLSKLPSNCNFSLGKVISNDSKQSFSGGILHAHFPSRRSRERLSGRLLASDLLKNMGVSGKDTQLGSLALPKWPLGYVGSVSHKLDECCVLVGMSAQLSAIGVDIELVEPLSESVWSVYSSTKEISQCHTLGVEPELFANSIFSIKESVFKCLYQILGNKTPAISDIRVEVIPSDDCFDFRATESGILCLGGVVESNGYIVSWAAVD